MVSGISESSSSSLVVDWGPVMASQESGSLCVAGEEPAIRFTHVLFSSFGPQRSVLRRAVYVRFRIEHLREDGHDTLGHRFDPSESAADESLSVVLSTGRSAQEISYGYASSAPISR